MSWSYYRDNYYTRADAVAAMGHIPGVLTDPRVALALTQIAVAEAALDQIMSELEDAADDS
jgi:proteasome assembly chaperone (PAC2) family protein